ncbi:MAG: nucleoside recognition domain-containing protein [Spirosomataceae bacterium]
MALNYIWVAFFIIAFVIALFKNIFMHDTEVFDVLVKGMFDSAKTGFEISLALTAVMTLFLGVLNIGEKAGAVRFLARIIGPFMNKLFPEVPKDHPAHGQMIMNFSANMLGLDNAATPFGLKAMQSLQELNPDKDRASNAQIMFLVLHTSGLTLIPISIMALRATAKAADPSDVFIPLLIGTYITTIVSLIIVAIKQKINLFDKTVFAWLGGITSLIVLLLWYLSTLDKDSLETFSKVYSNLILLLIIVVFIGGGIWKKINVYDAFIEGAKGGFDTAIKIIPYLVGMLVAIGVFRNSGAMDVITDGMKILFTAMGFDTQFVDALPVAIMRPLSGSGARGLMVDAWNTYGVDSFTGRLASIFQGTTDTTFYIVSLYFGSVGIRNSRYAVPFGLIADLIGVLAAIFLAYFFFI